MPCDLAARRSESPRTVRQKKTRRKRTWFTRSCRFDALETILHTQTHTYFLQTGYVAGGCSNLPKGDLFKSCFPSCCFFSDVHGLRALAFLDALGRHKRGGKHVGLTEGGLG